VEYRKIKKCKNVKALHIVGTGDSLSVSFWTRQKHKRKQGKVNRETLQSENFSFIFPHPYPERIFPTKH
jgi:hypothetical protein